MDTTPVVDPPCVLSVEMDVEGTSPVQTAPRPSVRKRTLRTWGALCASIAIAALVVGLLLGLLHPSSRKHQPLIVQVPVCVCV